MTISQPAHRRGQLDHLRLPLLLLLPALPPRKMLEASWKCLSFHFFSLLRLYFGTIFSYFSSSLLRSYFGTILWDTPSIHPTTSENSWGQPKSFHFSFEKWYVEENLIFWLIVWNRIVTFSCSISVVEAFITERSA